MINSKYAVLVEAAKQKRQQVTSNVALGRVLDSVNESQTSRQTLADELETVNQHITVHPDEVKDAASDYVAIAQQLVSNLHWPSDSVRIVPQGSSSTRTLIRSPNGNEKFDIDAVCAVDISAEEAKDPMSFFDKIGKGLANWQPDAKRRCWCVNISGRNYYIEFTPSVPLETIQSRTTASLRYTPADIYKDTALAVVDRPTRQWKTSNPEGFTKWVSTQAERKILLFLETALNKSYAMDSVSPVPEQHVPLSDTLRVAIRLLKRHRDMAARRGAIESECKPISVIIVTLLTGCYQGLADQQKYYKHPIELLIDLVELMPFMIETRDGVDWIENPTVKGENFAEKWATNPGLKTAFSDWCSLLLDDLNRILSAKTDQQLKQLIRDAFGTNGANTTPPPPSGSGLAPKAPTRVYPAPASGLA